MCAARLAEAIAWAARLCAMSGDPFVRNKERTIRPRRVAWSRRYRAQRLAITRSRRNRPIDARICVRTKRAHQEMSVLVGLLGPLGLAIPA